MSRFRPEVCPKCGSKNLMYRNYSNIAHFYEEMVCQDCYYIEKLREWKRTSE